MIILMANNFEAAFFFSKSVLPWTSKNNKIRSSCQEKLSFPVLLSFFLIYGWMSCVPLKFFAFSHSVLNVETSEVASAVILWLFWASLWLLVPLLFCRLKCARWSLPAQIGDFAGKNWTDKVWLIFNVVLFNIAVCDVAGKILGLGKMLHGHPVKWQGRGRIASVSNRVSLNGLWNYD